MACVEVEQAQTCSACGKPKHPNKDLLKCGRCKQAFYHDRACQKKHWSKHKQACQKLVQLLQEEKQQQENVRVEDTDDKGRVVIAKKDFAPGDVVILESPTVLFDTRLEYRGLLEAFGNDCSPTQRARVLDLVAPPLEQIDSAARRQRHARLEQQRQAYVRQHPERASEVTTAVTQKLLAIIETNAHQLFNANFDNNEGGNQQQSVVDSKQWMGLFVLGSMLEHSCNPNLTMNTTRNGKLELVAETSIKAGQRLAFSYIEGVFEKSRNQRQSQLREEKHFECCCERCQGVDDCRPVPLQLQEVDPTRPPVFWHAGQLSYVCVADPNNHAPLAKDDAAIARFVAKEVPLVQQLQALEQASENGTPLATVLPQVASLVTSEDWKAHVHPLHWLNVSACQFLSTAAAATARMHNPPNAVSLLRLSVLALLHNVVWVEQLVAALRRRGDDGHYYLSKLVAAGETPLQQIRQALQSSLQKSNNFLVPSNQIKDILQILCNSQPASSTSITADALLTAFYAGQDLILAGETELCVLLYQRYQPWFHHLRQPNEDNRAMVDVLVSSRGATNLFRNNAML